MTGYYPADAEQWLQHPLQHLYKVTVLPVAGPAFDVAVDGQLDITFDQEWTPYCQADVTIKTPSLLSQRDALDGRLGTQLRISAGYRYDGVDHLHELGTLRLQGERTPLPGGRSRLNAQGTEMILLDQGALKEGQPTNGIFDDQYTNRTGVVPFIRSWINRAYEPGPFPTIVLGPGVTDGAWLSEYVSQYQHGGGSNWSAIEGVARAAGLHVYHSGGSQWHIDAQPTSVGSTVAAKLRTGKHGTVTTADLEVNRAEWANEVIVQWDWRTDAGDNKRLGTAKVATGPLRASTLNTKQYRDFREGPVTTGYAQAYARNMLRKLAQRGRRLSLTAVAAYWLRPGMTVAIKTGRGPYQRRLVGAVTYSPLTGSMAVRTIRPEDYETE